MNTHSTDQAPGVQHTPAPWWPTDSGVRNRGGYIVHTNSVQRYGGQDERYAREVAQREADKRLIAAAPDLLDELRVARAALADFAGLTEPHAHALARRFAETITKATKGTP